MGGHERRHHLGPPGGDGLDGAPRTTLWVAAVALSCLGPYLTGVEGFTVHPGHFVERHGLIILIALGESVVAVGAGSTEIAVDWSLAAAALVVMTLLAGLWWDYFTIDAEAAEQALVAPEGPDRSRLARDIYSFLHIPLVLGIVFAAVGLHGLLAHSDEPLDPVFAGTFGGGVAMVFAGLAAIRVRRGVAPGLPCLAAMVVALAMIPVGREIDAIATVAVLAVAALAVAITKPAERQVVQSGT